GQSLFCPLWWGRGSRAGEGVEPKTNAQLAQKTVVPTESRLIDINFSIAHHSLSRQRTRVPAGTAALSREWQSLGIGARWSGAPATKERAMTLITPFSKIVVNGTTGDDTFNFSVNQFGAPNLSPFGVEYHSNGGNDNIIGTWHDDTFVLNNRPATTNST